MEQIRQMKPMKEVIIPTPHSHNNFQLGEFHAHIKRDHGAGELRTTTWRTEGNECVHASFNSIAFNMS